MIYSIRSSAFDCAKVYELTDDGLQIRQEGKPPNVIAYDAIRSVRLRYHGLGWYVCVVRTDSQKFQLTNKHYVKYGEHDDRSENYAAFVTELHTRLQPHAATIDFRQGSNTLKWLGVAMLILFPIGSVATFLLTANGRLVPTWNLRLALSAVPVVLSGMAIPLFKKGRTRPYSPESLPADFLPGRVD